MKSLDFYGTAHLFVAGIRVCEYQKRVPPSVEIVCDLLDFSPEKGHMISRKLAETGIIEVVEGAFGTRLHVRNHQAIEALPQGESDNTLEKELKKFHDEKKQLSKEVESFAARQEEKKRKLFASLEKKLKKDRDQG